MYQIIVRDEERREEIAFRSKYCEPTKFTVDLNKVLKKLPEGKTTICGLQRDDIVSSLGFTGWKTEVAVTSSDISGRPVEYWRDMERKEVRVARTFVAYPIGYVLHAGIFRQNMFGVTCKMYLRNIGKKTYGISGIMGAHLFPSVQNALRYVEKHKEVLHYLARKENYTWSIEPACEQYEKQVKPTQKSTECMNALNSLLDEVNKIPQWEMPDGDLTEEDWVSEAVERLARLKASKDVVNHARDGIIYMTDSLNSKVCALDDGAQQGIDEMKKSWPEFIPYHVIYTDSAIGELYAVLYVSKEKNPSSDPSSWEMERPDRQGNMLAYVYNATHPTCSELGGITVAPKNGGIVRLY